MFEQMATDLMDDVRAHRASRSKVQCTCSYGPDPDCRIDHKGAAEDRAIAAERKLASPKWMGETAGEIDELYAPLLWQFLIAGDDLEFCRRLRELFAAKANDEAKREITEDTGL